MIRTVTNSFLKSLGISVAIYWLQEGVGSHSFSTFLEKNLITILVTVTAINIATLAVLNSKLEEICYRKKVDINKSFGGTIKHMKLSIKEMITLIFASILLFILKESPIVEEFSRLTHQIVTVLFLSIFIYAILILYDTAMAIFIFYE